MKQLHCFDICCQDVCKINHKSPQSKCTVLQSSYMDFAQDHISMGQLREDYHFEQKDTKMGHLYISDDNYSVFQ